MKTDNAWSKRAHIHAAIQKCRAPLEQHRIWSSSEMQHPRTYTLHYIYISRSNSMHARQPLLVQVLARVSVTESERRRRTRNNSSEKKIFRFLVNGQPWAAYKRISLKNVPPTTFPIARVACSLSSLPLYTVPWLIFFIPNPTQKTKTTHAAEYLNLAYIVRARWSNWTKPRIELYLLKRIEKFLFLFSWKCIIDSVRFWDWF